MDKIDNVISTAASASLSELMSMWRARDAEEWSHAPELYHAIGERILHQGEPLLAYDVIREGLSLWPNDVRMRQLQGLALARSGATERANAVLEALRSEGKTDEETFGMLGRTYKDLAANAGSTSERRELLQRAAEIYGEAYRATGGYWTGINAATMNLLIGQSEPACEIAGKVREQCLREVQDPVGDQYWKMAALGEAALICRDLKEAEQWYARAAKEEGKKRYGDLQSSRRNARLIIEHWGEDPGWLDQYLCVPPVVVFAGHMIDRPGRAEPRFPGELEPAVAKAIRDKIDILKPAFGFSSAACGSDILFLEAMLEAGAEISVVLPYHEEEFVRDSVDFIPNANWRARFDRVLEKSARVIVASTQRLEIGGISYEFCNQLMLGLASIRARQLDTRLVPLVVWNRQPGDGPGGASSVVESWRALEYEPEIVDLAKIRGGDIHRGRGHARESFRSSLPEGRESTSGGAFTSRIVSILFADAVGFSKLSETEVPPFIGEFLGAIARLSDKFGPSIIAKNTWGDGLYFVFSEVDLAGKFALQLADLVANTNWEDKGFRSGLNLRIALHAGPAYEFDDPITGQRTYGGTHVSRAARLEPITPPGQVYASEAFAALAAAQPPGPFTCDYVGQTALAKGYGTLPVYHVRRRTAVAASL